MTVAKYPTAGNPNKSTVVYQDYAHGRDYAWHRCDNCGTSSPLRYLAGHDDHEAVNVLRREAKAHAAACDI
jgi:hypothetical protein